MPLISSVCNIPNKSNSHTAANVPLPKLNTKQIWFADDSAAGGKIQDLQKWWQNMQDQGPAFGYFPKASKTWLIVKEQYLEIAQESFKNINITTEGHRYLGSYIGNETGKLKFVLEKAKDWVSEIECLATIALKEPQAAYSAFVYGSSKRWGFLLRTTPNINVGLESVEDAIRNKLIPSITGRQCSDWERKLYSLPARYGGLGMILGKCRHGVWILYRSNKAHSQVNA